MRQLVARLRLAGQQLGGQLLAGGEPVGQRRLRRPAARASLRPLDDGRGAGVGLQVSALAAAAQPGVLGEVDDRCARTPPPWLCSPLTTRPPTMIPQPMPVPSVNRTMLWKLAAGADPELAVGGRVGVVGEGHRQPAVAAHPVADGEVVPALQVDRLEELAGGDVHGAGRAEADPGDGRRAPAPRVRIGLVHGGAHSPAASSGPLLDLGRDAQPGERPAQVVDHPDLDVRSAQVDSREKRRLGLAGGNELPCFRHADPLWRQP